LKFHSKIQNLGIFKYLNSSEYDNTHFFPLKKEKMMHDDVEEEPLRNARWLLDTFSHERLVDALNVGHIVDALNVGHIVDALNVGHIVDALNKNVGHIETLVRYVKELQTNYDELKCKATKLQRDYDVLYFQMKNFAPHLDPYDDEVEPRGLLSDADSSDEEECSPKRKRME
jgi:hypothetical protein